jgi:hypothetical protein
MPKRQSGHICYSIETVIETDIEDFTNVTPVMMIWKIECNYKNLKNLFNKYNFLCASYCSSSQTIVSLKALYRTISFLKVPFEVLLTTEGEAELLPEHDGIDDDGHLH